ncbi:MAG: HAD-IC family P-type ATPase [Chlorobi bacterium]|nr:HAD-IC family P-type ATPase [Chlorobiota bacterium]MCI0715861.1 HAD-IC family P-type ATPase [Chlorobiota bacterium]
MGRKGLSHQEVSERLNKGLVNKSTLTKTRTIPQILVENVFSVFNLVISAIIVFLLIFYFKTGDNRLFYDTLGVSTVLVLNTLIALIQEIRAKRALDKVSLLLKKEVKVIRDSSEQIINQNEVVADDLIVLERGDQVVVDGKVIESNKLEIDESLLTGESVPIDKKINDEVLSGSFCVSGNGLYIAEKVGDESYANRVTQTAKKFKLNLSPLQVKLNFIIKVLFSSAVFLVALEIIKTPSGFTDNDFVRKLSTIMISLVPQGLILMSSVSFALGIYRISKIGAIVQKLNAIESFSNVKIVCTDKTGTLTQNKLTVQKITPLTDKYPLSEIETLLGTYAKYSSDKNATLRTLEIYHAESNINALKEIPFSSENKMSLLQLALNGEKITLILGGFDILIEKSKNKGEANKLFENEGLKVYRNLLFGIETSRKNLGELENNLSAISIEPICIVSISDQVRDDVMEAINLFHKNDIEIKILSGDNALAVQAVAKEIGWDINDDELISGTEIDKVDDADFYNTIQRKKIFARLKPEHKLRIIKTLRKEKIYTAMIGDGVNDLPAIKESDMGIAMEEGSQITKEVADIVLLKNKFTLLPSIFEEGNKIVNTVASISKLFLTKNFMVIYFSLLSLAFMFEFPLTPRRVTLINIFSIGLPSFIIALKNANTGRFKGFSKELFSFVTISAAIIVGASYTGELFIAKSFPQASFEDIQMSMLSIMIAITASNFLAVTIHKGEKNIKLYILYAAGLVLLYGFLALTNIDFVIIRWLKLFYEITYLKSDYWGIVITVSLISSAVLISVQMLRQKYQQKD